jgi:hypothetical protein
VGAIAAQGKGESSGALNLGGVGVWVAYGAQRRWRTEKTTAAAAEEKQRLGCGYHWMRTLG